MSEKLTVIWTSRDKEVALNMGFMYAKNSKLKGWWDTVDFVIWGPSDMLVIEDEDIQEEIKILQNIGVNVKACIACAMRYGVVKQLQDLGIEVIPMGQPLTDDLKGGGAVITV